MGKGSDRSHVSRPAPSPGTGEVLPTCVQEVGEKVAAALRDDGSKSVPPPGGSNLSVVHL